MFTLVLAVGAFFFAHQADAYTYNQYEVNDLSVTQSSTTAGASNNLTVTFTIPSSMTSGLSTNGYLSLSLPYLYSYNNGSYTSDYLNITSATVSSSQLTKSYQGSSWVSFNPTSNLSAGQTVSITISGATNPSSLEGTGSFSIYGYESNSDTYQYFYGSVSQVYGTVDATLTVYDSNGSTPVRNVYVGLYYYDSTNSSSYEYLYGYTDATGKVQFAGLTSGRTYTVSFYYSGTTASGSSPANTTLTYSGSVLTPSYSFVTNNVTTHFKDASGNPISGAYWYFYKTDYTNYTTDYIWRSGTTDSTGLIKGAAQVDGSYVLYAYYSTNNSYYSYNFTVSGGVVSGLSDPVRIPSPEVSGTVYAGTSVASNVYVYVHNSDWSISRYVYTDSNGQFSFSLGTSGTYKLEIGSYNLPSGYYSPDATELTVTAGVAGSAQTINLLSATKTISGSVTMKASSVAHVTAGTPVTDAYIYGYQTSGNYNYFSTSVDSSGNFSAPVIGGTWTIYIYQQTWPSTWVYTGDTSTVSFASNSTTETATVNFSVTPYDSHITGRVVYPDGTPVAENAVYLYAYGGPGNKVYSYAYTNSSGEFDLKVTAGTFAMYAWFYGSSGSTGYSSPQIPEQTVEAGATLDLGEIELSEKNSYIQGHVKIRDTQEAVADHYVYAYRANSSSWDYASGYTDSSGFYSLNVAAGDWVVQTYAGDLTASTGQKVLYTGSGLSITIADNETVAGQDFNFDLADSSLSFTVQDNDGNTLSDQYGWVSVHDADDSDAYGWYNAGEYIERGTGTLDISANQEYEVTFYSYSAWNTTTEDTTYSFSHVTVSGQEADTVSADEGEILDVGLVMVENDASISGEFLDSEGNPKTVSAYVYASGENNQWASTYVDNASSYSIKVAPGTWKLSYYVYGDWQTLQTDDQKVEIEAGEEVTFNFSVLKSNSVISGTVLDPNGDSVTSPVFVKVSTVYGKDETATGETYGLIEKTTYTDDEGNFSVEVPSGDYYVTAASPDYLAPQPIQVTADSKGSGKNTKLKFLRSQNTISGTVTDGVGLTVNVQRIQAVGDPVAGAFVYSFCSGGSFSDAETDFTGAYSLDVPNNDNCFVGAIFQSGTTAYYSEKTEVEVKKQPVSLDLSLDSSLILPESQTVRFDPQEGTVVTMENGVTLEIPANAITADSSITEVTVVVTPRAKVIRQPGLEPLSIAYEFTASDQDGNPISQFASDVKITLPYDEEEVSDADTDEESLRVGYYEDAAGSWQHVDGGVIKHKSDNKFEVSVDHFSIFGVLASRSVVETDGSGDEDNTEEIPVEEGILKKPSKVKVKKNLGTKVTLTWKKVDSADSYVVRVKNTKTKKVVKRLTKTSNTAVLKNLKANKSYTVTIKSRGSTGSASGWSLPKTVHTRPRIPEDLQVSSYTSSTATFSWTGVSGNVKDYQVVILNADGSEFTRAKTEETVLMVEGLVANTAYQVKVRARTKSGVHSQFSDLVSFATPAE